MTEFHGSDEARKAIDAALIITPKVAVRAQSQQEGSIAAEAVELGDHQRRPGRLGEIRCLSQFRPIDLAAALNLGEMGKGLRVAGVGKSSMAFRRAPVPNPDLPCLAV